VGGWWRQLTAYVAAGGAVMWPLLAVSVALWYRALERWFVYRRWQREDPLAPFAALRTGERRLDRTLLAGLVKERRRELRRSLATVTVLAAVAPLLGLLGTVIGMVRTFQVISLYGTGHARAMAGGISLALVTTQTGLLVAIPGLLLATLLRRRARRLETVLLERASALQRRLGGEGGAA